LETIGVDKCYPLKVTNSKLVPSRTRKVRPSSGRPPSQKTLEGLKRVNAFLEYAPDATYLQISFVTGTKLDLLKKWFLRGHISRPAAPTAGMGLSPSPTAQPAATPPPIQEEKKRVEVDLRPRDDEWDIGPVPTIESIRRQIKRNMQVMHLDAGSVSSFATALARLESIKSQEKEAKVDDDRMTTVIYMPEEDKAPPADEPKEEAQDDG
jgi:hypothetical protein